MAEQRLFIEVSVKTDHPHPLKSPDYLEPAGSIEDNSSNQYFIYELQRSFNGLPFKLLDLGCAGGQMVVDIYNKGFPWVAVGLEGGNIYGMTKEFETKECITGPLSIARGSKNWEEYEGKCLFHADVSKPFEITNSATEDIIKFNIVTAYEFLEHPLPEEIPGILENVKKHLHTNGVFFGTINLSSGGHHRCGKPVKWWNDMFIKHGFSVQTYPFNTSPRTGLEYLSQLILIQNQVLANNPQVPLESVILRDETVVGTTELEKHLIDIKARNHLQSLANCNDENYPFCVTLGGS